MCDLDAIDSSSILRLLRNTSTLERIFPTLDLSCEKNTCDGNGTGWDDYYSQHDRQVFYQR